MLITKELVEKTQANFITLDELAYLFDSYFNQEWNMALIPASINKLRRMGLIDENGNITNTGEFILFTCAGEMEAVSTGEKSAAVNTEDKFDEIWKTFPRDDAFRHFPATRTIRWNKKETKLYYKAALESYTHEQLLNALKNEIAYRTTNSTKENLFKYIKSSVNWFKDQSYLNFIDDDLETNLENEFGKEVS